MEYENIVGFSLLNTSPKNGGIGKIGGVVIKKGVITYFHTN